MCDTLITKDGIELQTLGEARRYGITLSYRESEEPDHEDRCLCWLDLPSALAGHPSHWRERFAMFGDGWCEVGEDGRTWWEGFDIHTENPKFARMVHLSRSDGRRALTLDDWEAAQRLGQGAAQ